MIIEFTGIPGSGKSYISRLLGEKLQEAGEKVSEPSRIIGHAPALPRMTFKLLYTIHFILLHPLLASRLVSSIIRSGQRSPSDLIKSLVNILFLLGLVNRHRNSRGIVLLDQGLVQGLASVAYGASDELPFVFLEMVPLPDALIRVRVSLDVAVSRLSTRKTGGGSRVEKAPEDELKRFGAVLENVEARVLRNISVVIKADNEDNTPDRLINSLCKEILERKL